MLKPCSSEYPKKFMPTWATCNEEQLSTFGKTSRMIMDFSIFFSFWTGSLVAWCARRMVQIMEVRTCHLKNILHKPDRIGRSLRETRETMLSFMATSQHMHLNLRKSIPTSRKHFVRIQEVSNTSGKCPIWKFFKLGGIRMSAMDSTTNLPPYSQKLDSWVASTR